ncbi:MAG: hypothetical protein HYT15_01875 [Candidatus Magasanikbacteria bacterium]|nr:hypothetical protein [Candidatus Magasanikbacteria bacterium]
MNLPMLVVWIIAFSVTLIVMGAAFSYRIKGESMGMALLTVAAITFWMTGLVLGFFVTLFSSPTPETWWWALAIRVVWQIGGAAFFGLAILFDSSLIRKEDRKKIGGWIFVAVCVAIGVLVSLNPLRDLVQGPVTIHGTINLEILRQMRPKYGPSIRGALEIATPEGTHYGVNMFGWPVQKAEEILEQCDNTGEIAIIVMLQRMNRLLDAWCR